MVKCVHCFREMIMYNSMWRCVHCLKNSIAKTEIELKNLKSNLPSPDEERRILGRTEVYRMNKLCPHCRVPLQPPIQACPECGFD